MPARKTSPSPQQTRLARVRVAAGVTQDELAAVVGVSARTLARLEQNLLDSPPIGWLVNCHIALGVSLEEVCEPRYLEWTVLNLDTAEPPAPGWLAEMRARRA